MKNLRTLFAAITLMIVAAAQTASAEESWSFVMLGDTRDADNTSTGISPYLNNIAQKIASLNPRPQLVVMVGDLCNGDALNTDSPLYPTNGSFTDAAMKPVYAGFFTNWQTAMQPVYDYHTHTGISIYTVRGNHENTDSNRTKPIAVLKEAYQEAFSAYVPTNGPDKGTNDDERGFSWFLTTNNVTFVAADQYFHYDPDYILTTPWSGYHYLDRQWVTQQLQQATSPYKIFLAHEPIFQTAGNSPSDPHNVGSQHFFGTNAAAMQTRTNFWNDIGDAGAQLYLCGHLHLETVAATTNDHGRTIIQLTAGNGGAPPQEFVDDPEPGVTTLYNNGNISVTNNETVSVQGYLGFALATVTDEKMTIHYYTLNPANTNWTVAAYVTQIASAKARPSITLPPDPRAGTFSYTRSDPAGTRLIYQVETSPDLSTWSVDAAGQTVTATTDNIQTVHVTLGGPKPLAAPQLFIRISAQ